MQSPDCVLGQEVMSRANCSPSQPAIPFPTPPHPRAFIFSAIYFFSLSQQSDISIYPQHVGTPFSDSSMDVSSGSDSTPWNEPFFEVCLLVWGHPIFVITCLREPANPVSLDSEQFVGRASKGWRWCFYRDGPVPKFMEFWLSEGQVDP